MEVKVSKSTDNSLYYCALKCKVFQPATIRSLNRGYKAAPTGSGKGFKVSSLEHGARSHEPEFRIQEKRNQN